ncbi:MAG: hypothetical protein MUC73_04290 [Cyclobacteriaceae bacterium]|jgi:hypothetical protein|nr:hypothetical protein [Cyclobacteriaceae bacterium]
MNRIILLVAVTLAIPSFAQDKKIYTTTSGELIFSFANISDNGSEEGSIIRFSPVVNIQNWVNIDKSDHFGMFTGLSIRNVGFIYDVPDDSPVKYDYPDETNVRKKFRTYNLGIPVGFKFGNLNDKFLFVGYELEIPINYKEKTFIGEDKEDKNNVWFSSRTNTFNHSLMAGIQLPYGATLKFKYYLTNFFNKDFSTSDGQGGSIKPYQNVDVNVFYFSLNFFLLKNVDFYYKEK